MNKKQMNKRLEYRLGELERQLEDYKQKTSAPVSSKISADDILRYFIADKQNTNVLINALAEQIKSLRDIVNETTIDASGQDDYREQLPEVVLSGVDTKILNFIQTQPQGMSCADDVRKHMGYKGNNAACARLRNLEKLGLLVRHQIGHKVYYTGKATMQLIVSPPQ